MATLSDLIARVRALKLLPKRVAARGAPLVEAALKNQAAAGVDPNGQAWALTKKGERALKNAASKISASSKGPTIIVKLRGPEVFHNRGTKSHPRRQILPSSGNIPPHVRAALDQAIAEEYSATISGAR